MQTRNRLPVLLLILLCAVSIQLNSQSETPVDDTCHNITFQKVFLISSGSLPNKLIQTKDGGYLISGSQSDDFIGNGDGMLLKLNKYGEKQWIRGYNRTDADYILSGSDQLPDSSYITAANQFDSRGILQKTDKNGSLIWQKAYSITTGSFRFYEVLANSDATFFATGEFFESSSVVGTIIVKFDSDGNVIWQKIFYNGSTSYPATLSSNNDTLFVTGFMFASEQFTHNAVYIMKMAITDGTIYDLKRIWIENHPIGNISFIKRADNKYILTTDFFDQNSGEPKVVMTLFNTNLDNSQSVEITNLPQGFHLTTTAVHDTSIAVAYQTISNIGYLLKFDKNLDPVFGRHYTQVYGDNNQYFFTGLKDTKDSGFMISGFRFFSDSGASYLIKTDPNGKTGTCNTISDLPSIRSITVNSESFLWDLIVDPELNMEELNIPVAELNNSDSTLCSNSTCDQQCTIYAPNGKIYLCHVPPGNTGNPQQLILPLSAVNWHLSHHPDDRVGICGHPCTNFRLESNNQDNSAIENLNAKVKHVSIYPNPTINSFTIRFNEITSRPLSLNIFSLEGKTVYTLKNPATLREINFGSNFAPGIYFVEVRFNNRREVFKIVKLN